jgi:hypothetical protein
LIARNGSTVVASPRRAGAARHRRGGEADHRVVADLAITADARRRLQLLIGKYLG